MSSLSSNHSIGGGVLQIDAATDGMGVFIRRISNGIGNISSVTTTLILQVAPNLQDNFQVFGVEMVYIPEDSFSLGDGTTGSGNKNFSGPSPYNPIFIDSTVQANGLGVVTNYQPFSQGSTVALPSTFPLGYNSYYSMKYEMSQEQYADFLNTLTFNQQITRTSVTPMSAVGTRVLPPSSSFSWDIDRSEIKIVTPAVSNAIYNTPHTPAVYSSTSPNLPCNWLAFGDLLAYLDWAGLRPMTEFEFEKSCRGPVSAVPNENAWGTTSVTAVGLNSGMTNLNAPNESNSTTGLGLCAANNTSFGNTGPLRCGFAATNSTTRITAGSSYYGLMDMSGNAAEMCLGGWSGNYSSFTTSNGDGTLTANGDYNVVGWSLDHSPRGGNYEGSSSFLNVSFRISSSNVNSRNSVYGGRGVRNW